MASFTPLDNFKSRGRGLMPTGIVIDKSCRVYITQIPLERIERDGVNALKAEFEVYGPLESYKMFTDRSGRFVGSALCTYRNPADASMAVYCMDGVEVEGSTLHVEPAKEHGVVLLSGSSRGGVNRDHSRGFLRDTQREEGRGGRGRSMFSPGGHSDGWSRDSLTGSGHAQPYPTTLADEGQSPKGPGLTSTDRASTSAEGERWSHDKYQLIAEGKDMDEVLGLRRPHQHRGRARGRGGRGSRRNEDRVDAAFERYIHERDAQSADIAFSTPQLLTAAPSLLEMQVDVQPTAIAAASKPNNVDGMSEIAFGCDNDNEPVTGEDLGALSGDL